METIKTYVNNMFINLPQTDKIIDLKNEILQNMEDKYNELKAEGKSEHEAISIVISEFGNIDELLEELDIKPEDNQPTYTIEDIHEYQRVEKKKSRIIAAGVFLCIFGVAISSLLDDLSTMNLAPFFFHSASSDIINEIPLFLCIAAAVGLFIFSSTLNVQFKNIKKELIITPSIKYDLEANKKRIQPAFYRNIAIGVILCILSPVSNELLELSFGKNNGFADFFMLFIIAIAVYLFVSSGITYDSYDSLLNKENETALTKKMHNAYAICNSIIFLTATILFLVSGLGFNLWAKNWIIYVVAGLLSAIASTIIHYSYENKKLSDK